MSVISDAKGNYDSVLAAYTANPPTATLAQVITALGGLTTAIAGTSPAPTTDPDLTTYNSLDAYQSLLVAYQLQSSQAGQIGSLQSSSSTQAGQISTLQTNVSGMETADSYEAASAASSTAAGNKYYEIVVPNFVEVPLPAGGVQLPTDYVDSTGAAAAGALPAFSTSTSGGTSFLRLGSSPDSSQWSTAPFTNSVNLARLVGDPLAIALSENMSLTTTSPTALIGNVDNPGGSTLVFNRTTSSAPYNQGQSTTATMTAASPALSSTFADAFVDGSPPTEGTPWSGTAFGSAQDPNFLLGFADDTRWRGAPESSETINSTTSGLKNNNNLLGPEFTLISNQQVPNVNANRQAETLKLLTKGGWWDHSDGNRVSTTMGDKVEVVQGNYKLVVLGRQQAPTPPPISNTVNLQACLQTYPTLLAALNSWYGNGQPTDPTSTYVTAIQNILPNTINAGQVAQRFAYQVQVWLMTQNSFITDMSGGHFQEQYPSPTPCIKTVEYSQDNNNEWTLYQDNTQGNLITRLKGRTVDLFQGTSRETYVGSGNRNVLWASGGTAASFTSPDNATTGDLRLDPMLASYTWAQSVYSQTGSETKPIGYGPASNNPSATGAISANAGPQPSGVQNGAVVSKTWANTVWSQTGSPATPIGGASPSAGASSVPSSIPSGPGALSQGDVLSVTWAQRVMGYTGSSTNPIPYVYAETNAVALKSLTTVTTGGITSITTSAGGITSSTSSSSGDITNTTSASSGNLRNLSLTTGGLANVSAAGAGMTNISAATMEVLNLTVGAAVQNLTAGVTIVNLNLGAAMIGVDLTPVNVHCGINQHDMSVYRSLIAPNVQLGAAPDVGMVVAAVAGVLGTAAFFTGSAIQSS